MRIIICSLVSTLALANSAIARVNHRRAVCVPVYIEGAGTVRICAPARAR